MSYVKTSSWKIGAMVVASVLATQMPAQASRSLFYPNTSSNYAISYSLQKDLSLKDDDGKAMTLTQGGYILTQGEDASKLTPDELAQRKIAWLEIGYNGDTRMSYLGLMSAGGVLGIGSREAKFGLPVKVQIDDNGYPMGIENVNASAKDTGQGLGLQLLLSNPGTWVHYAEDSTQSCLISVTQTVCDTGDNGHAGGNCHSVSVNVPGLQGVHTEGDRKTDGYSVKLESDGQIGFAMNYDTGVSNVGPCVAAQ